MKKFNTKRSANERNTIYETYTMCYYLFSILIFIDIVIKFNFYDIFLNAPQRWLEFWVESIIFVTIFYINIIMLARKGITLGTRDLPKDVFQKRRYASISAEVGLIIAISLWIIRALTGVYPGSWGSGVFIYSIWMIYTFIVVFLLLYLTFFIAYIIAIIYNNKKSDKINKQRLITENNQKNKIYKRCYFLFLILIFIDIIVKINVQGFFDGESHWWVPFIFEFIFYIMIFFINIIVLAVNGITVGIGDLPNNVFHKGRYASISAITGLIVGIGLYGYLIGWILIDVIQTGYLDGIGVIVVSVLFLLTFTVIFILSYTIFYIGYKIVLEHNNSTIVRESNDVINDTKKVETLSADSGDISVKK